MKRLPEIFAARDLTFAIRQFRRAPALTVGIVLSLGFGIGASGAVFAWMDGTVLNPLPAVRDPGRLITVRPELRNGFAISAPEFDEWRAEMRSVTGLAAASISIFGVHASSDARGATQPLFGMYVSPEYFPVLGVKAAAGRVFDRDDDRAGAPLLAVISHTAWTNYFAGDAGIIGRQIVVNGKQVRVIGVGPRNFNGHLSVAAFDIWFPLHAHAKLQPAAIDLWHARDVRWLDALGRLRDGGTLEQADAEIRTIANRQAAAFVESQGRGAQAIPLDMGQALQLYPLFVALVIVMAFVVLLICANIANLLLARAAARTREIAVRVSLGASRGRIVRQLMSESVLLAIVGTALGLGLAVAGQKSLWVFVPDVSVSLRPQWELNARFLMVVAGIAVAAVLAFGLAPALVGSRLDVVASLRGNRASAAAKSPLRTHLVVVQFVLALSALVTAATFVRFDRALRSFDVGYRDGDRVLLMRADMAFAGRSDLAQWNASLERALERVRGVPGVESAAMASFVPLGLGGYMREPVEIAGQTVRRGQEDRVLVNGISAGYFELMRIPIVQGRPIALEDDATRPRAVVVNEAFATRYFPGASALGRTIRLGGVDRSIVGITPTGRYDYRNVEDAHMPLVYYPLAQQPTEYVALHVRTRTPPLSLAGAVRNAALSADSTLALFTPTTLENESGIAFAISRSAASILGVLATAALLLASMGLFSVVAYGVAMRTNEIGIRLALGATGANVMRMFLTETWRLTAYGTGVGLAVAGVFSIALRSRIAKLPTASAAEFVAPVLLLVVSAAIATLVPARTAAAVDPARTLRSE